MSLDCHIVLVRVQSSHKDVCESLGSFDGQVSRLADDNPLLGFADSRLVGFADSRLVGFADSRLVGR